MVRPATQASESPSGPPATAVSVIGARPWQRLMRVVVLALTDLTALFLCGSVAYLAWARPVHGQPPALYLGLAPLLLLFVAGYARTGLYPGFGLGPVETLRRLSLVTASSFLVLAAFSFAFKLPHRYSRLTFVIAFLLSLFAVPLARHLVASVAGRRTWWREPVVLVGKVEVGALSPRNLSQRRLGYRVAAAVDPNAEDGGEISGIPLLAGRGGFDEAHLRHVAERGVHVAVLLQDQQPSAADLDLLHGLFRRIVTLRRLRDLPVEGAQVRNLGGVLGIEYTNNLLTPRNRLLKRALDLAVASAGLLLALPVIALGSAAVKILSPGPAFFVQQRAGLGGRPIGVPKIRTMVVDAERRLEEHLADDPELAREWEKSMKLRHDPRLIPHLGGFLRRFSLDELPQLWSVVKGDMSLVGPRPFPEYHLQRFGPEFRHLRQRVRPGITGPWQVSVRSAGGLDEQHTLDSYYIRNWSMWMDFHILARTLAAVLRGKGAY